MCVCIDGDLPHVHGTCDSTISLEEVLSKKKAMIVIYDGKHPNTGRTQGQIEVQLTFKGTLIVCLCCVFFDSLAQGDFGFPKWSRTKFIIMFFCLIPSCRRCLPHNMARTKYFASVLLKLLLSNHEHKGR